MAGNQHSPTVISFGPFEADLHTQELRKLGARLRLPGQSFQILTMLLKQPGELITARNCSKPSGLPTLTWTSSAVSMPP
jgi:DNA-binding response OmpR family regulator